MRRKQTLAVVLGLLTAGFGTASAIQAATFDISFADNDALTWSGVVDTTSDTLTITSWTVVSSPFRPFWTPDLSSGALTFSAVNLSDQSAFDVPDTWDGSIDSTWGFLGDVGKDQIDWLEGTFTENTSALGWGISQLNNGNFTGAGGTEIYFQFVPYNATGNFRITADSVTVTPNEVPPIPLPASFPILLTALGAFGMVRLRRTRQG